MAITRDLSLATLSANRQKLDDISSGFDGANTDFTLTVSSTEITPSSPNHLIISLNGVIQEPTTSYNVTGSTLSFTTAPASTATFFGVHTETTTAGNPGTPPDGSVGTAQLSTANVAFDSTTLFIDSTNNRVGVGTITADGLTVNDTIRLDNEDTTMSIGDVFGDIEFYDNDGGSTGAGVTAKIEAKALSTYGASNLNLYTSGSSGGARTSLTQRMQIDGNGDINFYDSAGTSAKFHWDAADERLGIGTTSPTQPLHINATSPSEGIVAKFVSDGAPWVQLTGTSTSWQIGSTANGLEVYNDDNLAYLAALNTYGDLGLGTNTPNVYGSGAWRTITLNGTSGGEVDFEVSGSVTGEIIVGAQDFYIRHLDSNANMRFRVGGSSINEERMTIDGASGTVGIQSRVAVGTLNSKTGYSRMRVGRSLINFFNYGQNSGTDAYLHVKTNLYGGSGSNTQPTMSLVHIKGYTYSGDSINSMLGFHNWNGSFYNPVYTNNGSRTAVSSSYPPYMSSDGYVVLVVNIGTSNYPGITIDWHQNFEYTFQDIQVSAYARSNSTSGVY